MLLLITYVLIALGFSFLCSIAEAVLLSVTDAHIALLKRQQNRTGTLFGDLKKDVNRPLAAILTLNTIAHTVGAAGAGAQAVVVFGNAYIGIASAVLTLLILVFSEIIPKTLGAHYWRQLSPVTAFVLTYLVIVLYPFVKLSEKLTTSLTHEPEPAGFSREEFLAVADLSYKEGRIEKQESQILSNLLLLQDTDVTIAMTPRMVIYSLSETTTVEIFFHKYEKTGFSRIPIYKDESENITGFVLRSDLLLAQARGNGANRLENYRRDIAAVHESMSLFHVFKELIRLKAQLMLVIDEYGGIEGLITLEDVLETLIGLEIVDEKDETVDMQKKARRLWKRRAEKMGIELEAPKDN